MKVHFDRDRWGHSDLLVNFSDSNFGRRQPRRSRPTQAEHSTVSGANIFVDSLSYFSNYYVSAFWPIIWV